MGIRERKEREKSEIRNRIVRAASDIVAREGHENLTVRKLAAAIEYSPRTIYLYFKDRDAVLQEVVESGFRRTLSRRAQETPRFSGSPKELIAHRIRRHIETAVEEGNFYRAVVTVLMSADSAPGPAQQSIVRETREELRAVLPHDRRTEEEVDRFTMIFFSSLRGFTLSLVNRAEPFNEQERATLVDEFISFVLRALTG